VFKKSTCLTSDWSKSAQPLKTVVEKYWSSNLSIIYLIHRRKYSWCPYLATRIFFTFSSCLLYLFFSCLLPINLVNKVDSNDRMYVSLLALAIKKRWWKYNFWCCQWANQNCGIDADIFANQTVSSIREIWHCIKHFNCTLSVVKNDYHIGIFSIVEFICHLYKRKTNNMFIAVCIQFPESNQQPRRRIAQSGWTAEVHPVPTFCRLYAIESMHSVESFQPNDNIVLIILYCLPKLTAPTCVSCSPTSIDDTRSTMKSTINCQLSSFLTFNEFVSLMLPEQSTTNATST